MITRPVYIPGGSGSLPSASGNALRRLRVNETGTAAEWANDSTEVINVEEARSDIRSRTRAGYSTFDSQPGLQTLLDTVGMYKTLLLPDGGEFFLNGKNLVTGSKGQTIKGHGNAAFINGGVNVHHRFTELNGFYIVSPPSFGVQLDLQQYRSSGAPPADINDTWPNYGPQVPLRFLSNGDPTDPFYTQINDPYYANCMVRNIHVAGAPGAAINVPCWMGWSFFREVHAHKCGYYCYVDMTNNNYDSGDLDFSGCHGMRNTNGMYIVKTGGLRLTDCKMHSNANYGLKLETPLTPSTLQISQGTYLTGSSFEDNGGKDVWITAQAGVPSNKYPRWTQIVGGTVMNLYLEKCADTTIDGTLVEGSCYIGTEALRTILIPGLKNDIPLTGPGTDYIFMGIDAANGPYIKTGKRLTVLDQDGSAIVGSYLTTIAGTPAYIGQRAFYNGLWYLSKGTSSPADWASLGGGGLDGGIFTDTYTIAGLDGGAF